MTRWPVVTLAVTLLLLAHAASARGLPAWVTEPPHIGETITAVGSGKTLTSARQDAISVLLHTLSTTVSSDQELAMQQRDGQTTEAFSQTVSASSLTLDLENIKIDQHHSDSNRHIVRIMIPGHALVRSLSDSLNQTAALTPLEGSRRQQFVWALQHRGPVVRGLRYERVLSVLGHPQPAQRRHLESLIRSMERALSQGGVRVIAGSDLSFLAPTLSRHFRGGGEELFWLKADLRRFNAQSRYGFQSKLVVDLELISSDAPFAVVATSALSAEAEGPTPALAEQNAQKQLVTAVQQPMADWFF